MQDRELVAAILAGDPDGLAEAYDRYAASLYAYCRFMLLERGPSGDAADAVRDTFIVATSRLQGLRDPDRLGSWLDAVARNECLRRLSAAAGAAGLAGRPVPGGPVPAVALPAGLREQVLTTCDDSTPTGRAYRMSVAHRAGPFGRTGFPKPVTPSGPHWWQEARRRPRAAVGMTAVAAAVVAVVAAGVIAILMVGAPHRAHASTLALGGGISGSAGVASGQTPGASSAPGHKTPLVKDSPSPSVTASGSTTTQGRPPGKPSSPAPSSSVSSPSPSPSPSPFPSPSPSPSPSPPPSQGILTASPTKLVLTAVKGKAATGTFILTAAGGPVDDFVIHVPAKVTVSPSSGSLLSAGSWVTLKVTVTSLVSLNTHLTVDPGGLTITVVLTITA